MGTAEREELEIDERLIAQAQADPARFTRLYDRHFDRVYAFALLRSGSRAVAEDVTSETFHRALRELPRFEWRGLPYSAWLLRVARNLIADEGRRSGRLESLDAAPEESMSEPPQQAELQWRTALYAWVRRLPPDQQRVIELRFGAERSIAETAAELGRSPGAIKQLQLRAIRNLQQQATKDE